VSTAELTDNLTADLLAAIDQGNDLEAYLVGRAAGCTHAELLELPALDLTHTQNDAYIAARGYGTTVAGQVSKLPGRGGGLRREPGVAASQGLEEAG
jgi:hypothetical protein